MKKTLFFGLLAAILGFTACSNEDDVIGNNQKNMVLRATVEQPEETRATIDGTEEWHFDFETNDKVSVTNSAISNTYYTFTNNGTEFTSGDAQTTETDATWYAYFPSNEIDLTGQSGIMEDVANKYALVGKTASATTGADGLSITMSPQVAILVITNQKDEININVKTSATTWVKGLKANGDGFTVTTAEEQQNLLSVSDVGTYYIAVPAGVQLAIKDGDEVLKSTGENGLTAGKYYKIESTCVAAGTMITMENGDRKAVEELVVGDVICTFDHKKGEMSSAPVCFIWESKNVTNAFTLTFEGGIEVSVIEEHGFYDQEEMKYTFINANNAKDYFGHHFYDADNARWLELKSCKRLNKGVDAYAIVTSRHLNHLSNGMLSMSDGSFKFLANIFEYDDQLKFDADKKEADIETYGLTPIEKILELEGFTEADYYDYNLMYLNVAIGKGLISWDYVKALSDYCVANGIY